MGKKNTTKTLADETSQLVHHIIEQSVDGIIAGWPCQDLSIAAGAGAKGLGGERSGLWKELFRTICLVRPKFTLLENVAALLNRGMGDVLGNMAEVGIDAQWNCIRAKAVGLPHDRERLYIIAYPMRQRLQRHFPKEIQGQSEFSWWQNYRSVADLPERSDIYPSQLCRGGNGFAKRLHGIGNGNPAAVIREITRGLQ
jgi:DNA (cytosine-5)-methyltransferase 1